MSTNQNDAAHALRQILDSPDAGEIKAERLAALKTQLAAKLSADRPDSFGPIFREIDEALDGLTGLGGEAGTRSATDIDSR